MPESQTKTPKKPILKLLGLSLIVAATAGASWLGFFKNKSSLPTSTEAAWRAIQGKRERGQTLSEGEARDFLNIYLDVIRGLPRKKISANAALPEPLSEPLPELRPVSWVEWQKSRQAQCLLDEYDFSRMHQELVTKLRRALELGDVKIVSSLLSPKLMVLAMSPAVGKRIVDSVEISHLAPKEKSSSSIFDLTSEFKTIDDVELTSMQYQVVKRDTDDSTAQSWKVWLRFDIRGLDKTGARRNDRGIWIAEITKAAAAPATLDTLVAQSGESVRLVGRGPAFENTTATMGLAAIEPHLRREAIRRGGYAMALSDMKKDGHLSLYVGSPTHPEFYQQNNQGQFAKLPLASVGLGDDSYAKSAAFVDLHNQGFEDLVITRFDRMDGRGGVLGYKNDGHHFSIIPDFVRNQQPSDFAMPMALADFNGDGFVDLYVGFPGSRDFTVGLTPEDKDKHLSRQGVFANHGGDYMEEVTARALPENADGTRVFFPHAALAADINGDHHPDLIVIDDRGQLSPIFVNDGQGKFVDGAKDLAASNSDWGMGVSVGDFNLDGVFDIAMTNVNLASSERLQKSCALNHGVAWVKPGAKGLRFFKGLGGGKMTDVTNDVGLEWAGEGLAGVEFVDYNNDGYPDLIVSNGLWSSEDRDNEMSPIASLSHIFMSSEAMWLDGRKTSSFLDILASFKGDSLTGKPGPTRPSMAGHQHKRLFLNDRNGHFVEVGYLENADSVSDGYMIALADIDHDGRQDIILRNADPGTAELSYPSVEVLHNVHPNKNSVRLRLVDHSTNRGAIGAEAVAQIGNRTLKRQLTANNGAVQSEKLLFFGLGEAKSIDRLTIYWPDATTTEMKDVKPGLVDVERDSKGHQSTVSRVARGE